MVHWLFVITGSGNDMATVWYQIIIGTNVEKVVCYYLASLSHKKLNNVDKVFILSETITVECRYNAVQYNTILSTALQRLRQNLIRGWSHERDPYLTLTEELWVSFVRIWMKINQVIKDRTVAKCMTVTDMQVFV